MDPVAIHLLLDKAVQRISFQGPDKPALDLAGMQPGQCAIRLLRKVVQMLAEDHHMPDTPGYEAIKRQSQYSRARTDKPERAAPGTLPRPAAMSLGISRPVSWAPKGFGRRPCWRRSGV